MRRPRGRLHRWLKRLTVLAALGFTAALLVAPGSIAATLASDVIPPGTPPGVNILPSTVKGAAVGATRAEYTAALMYQYARSPQFWAAVAAQKAGTATAGQITLVQQANGSFGVPATKAEKFVKGVGGAAAVVSTFSIGSLIGNGTLNLLGYDADGAVCGNTTGVLREVLAILSSVDCSGFYTLPDTFVRNSEVVPGILQPPACTAAYGGFVGWSATWTSTLEACSSGSNFWRATSPSVGPWGEVGWVALLDVYPTPDAPGSWTFVTYRHKDGASSGGSNALSQFNATCLNDARDGPEANKGVFTISVAPSAGEGGVFEYVQPWTAWGGCTTDVAVDLRVRGPVEDEGDTLGDYGRSPMYRSDLGTVLPGVVEASSDPERTLRCVITHSGGVVTRDSAAFKESDGALPQVLCPSVEGLSVESVEVLNVNSELPPEEAAIPVYEEETTPEYQDHQALAPECADGTCLLDLRKEGATCFQSPESCADWFADPDKGSKYSCHYGTHAVDLSECTVYAPTFKPDAQDAGNVYGDPETGATVGAPPGAGTSTSSEAFGLGVQQPNETRECLPQGWAALNPIEWVMRPVMCALEWAFVPRAQVVQSTGTRVLTAWDDTLPAQAPKIAGAWIAALPEDLGGCQGPPIDFGPVLDPLGVEAGGVHYPLSACEEPWDVIASIANVVSTGTVTILGAFAIVRYLAATIGYVGVGKGGSAG